MCLKQLEFIGDREILDYIPFCKRVTFCSDILSTLEFKFDT